MKIDLKKCIHCGVCFATYEKRIEQKDGNFAVREGIEMTGDEKQELITTCPAGAIGE